MVRTYNPNPRRGLEAPPELVPKEIFEQAVLRLLPSLSATDLSHLAAVFRDAVRGDCVSYKSFLQALLEASASRQDCALRVFEDLVGSTSGTLNLADTTLTVPPGATVAFGDRPVFAIVNAF